MAARSSAAASEAPLPAPGLARALAAVADAMLAARDPWWVIGSAAMALHGARVSVGDIDLVTSVADAERLFGDLVAPGRESDRFRSDRFGSWQVEGMTVEVMAGLQLRGGGWRDVDIRSREPVRLGGHLLFTPGAAGLLDLCRQFDRPKDRARAALLEAAMSPAGDM